MPSDQQKLDTLFGSCPPAWRVAICGALGIGAEPAAGQITEEVEQRILASLAEFNTLDLAKKFCEFHFGLSA